MENVKKINDELTVAGQITPEQLQQASQEGFKSVFNLRSQSEETFWSDEQQQAESLGLQYFHIPVAKIEELTEELTTEVLAKIDEIPKPALVHCAAALRAGAMALMYVATRQGMSPEQAFEQAERIGFDCSAHPQAKEFFKNYVEKYSQMQAR
jgi:uncharacterized protein (TIGR01244 family)